MYFFFFFDNSVEEGLNYVGLLSYLRLNIKKKVMNLKGSFLHFKKRKWLKLFLFIGKAIL